MSTARLAVQGVGLVGGMGNGREAALQALHQGVCPEGRLTVRTPHGEKTMTCYAADTTAVKRYFNVRELRRVNRFSSLAALAACLALEDAGYAIPCRSSRMAVIVASGYGAATTTFQFLDNVILEGDSFASPIMFANSVHSSAASNVTILLQINGPCLTITHSEMAALNALLNARILLESGMVDAVLLGGVDELNGVLAYSYERFFGENTAGAILPLAFDRQSAIPGEGAAFLLLTGENPARAPAYGYLQNIALSITDSLINAGDDWLIPASSGHHQCGPRYRKLLKDHNPDRIKAFSPLYGSMPSGQIFDLALGALASQTGIIGQSFCSFKAGANLETGQVTFERSNQA